MRLLLIVHSGTADLFARHIGSARTNRAAFAIGRDDDAAAGSQFAALLNVEPQRTIVNLVQRPGV